MLQKTNLIIPSIFALLFCTGAQATDSQVSHCMMRSCVLTKVLDKTLIKTKDGASLYKVVYQEGITSQHDENGQNPLESSLIEGQSLQRDISWHSPNQEYVFCSNKLPAVITTIAKIVPLNRDSLSHGRVGAISVYATVCHNVSMTEFLTEKFQRSNNYQDSGLESILVKQPERLFDFLDAKVLEAYEYKL